MIKIPFVDTELGVPIIEFMVGNQKHTAIIDSGSQCTIFRRDIGEEVCNTDLEVVTLSGSKKIKSSDRLVKTLIEDEAGIRHELEINGNYFDDNTMLEQFDSYKIDCLIGSDFLNQISAKIDYENKHLVI